MAEGTVRGLVDRWRLVLLFDRRLRHKGARFNRGRRLLVNQCVAEMSDLGHGRRDADKHHQGCKAPPQKHRG